MLLRWACFTVCDLLKIKFIIEGNKGKGGTPMHDHSTPAA